MSLRNFLISLGTGTLLSVFFAFFETRTNMKRKILDKLGRGWSSVVYLLLVVGLVVVCVDHFGEDILNNPVVYGILCAVAFYAVPRSFDQKSKENRYE